MIDGIREAYCSGAEHSQAEIVRELVLPAVLMLGDVGRANVKTIEWYRSIYCGVIDARYKRQLPVVLTTSLSPQELEERLGLRTMSRLYDMGVGVCLDGPDGRRLK